MTTINTDHDAMWVARDIQQIMEENGIDAHKKRTRDDHGRRVVNVRAVDKSAKVKIAEVGEGRSEIDLTFAGKQISEAIEGKFGSSGRGVVNAGKRDRPERNVSKEQKYESEREGSNRERSSHPQESKDMKAIDVMSDGSVVMMPPFTKEEADYTETGDGPNCGDCVHYLEGGGCALVQGEIDETAYCERFYADVGLFGNNNLSDVLNLKLWGEDYDFSQFDINQFVRQVEEAMEEKSEEEGSV